MGSNPGTVNWMDIFSHIFVVKIVMILFEKTENKQKRSRGWPIFKKTKTFSCFVEYNAVKQETTHIVIPT